MKISLKEYPDRDNLVTDLACEIVTLLAAGISKNDRASLALSGGSTPVQLFECLSHKDIAWEKVEITLVDERWVEPSDPDSNEHLVRRHLLQDKAASAAFVGMKNFAITAGAGEDECEKQLRKLCPHFDCLILGMGNDGHTASFFPGVDKLPMATDLQSGRLCVSIAPLTAPHERMTLTLPAILDSRQIFIHIVGQDKKDVLQEAVRGGAVEEMPIRYVLNQKRTPVTVYWAP